MFHTIPSRYRWMESKNDRCFTSFNWGSLSALSLEEEPTEEESKVAGEEEEEEALGSTALMRTFQQDSKTAGLRLERRRWAITPSGSARILVRAVRKSSCLGTPRPETKRAPLR